MATKVMATVRVQGSNVYLSFLPLHLWALSLVSLIQLEIHVLDIFLLMKMAINL